MAEAVAHVAPRGRGVADNAGRLPELLRDGAGTISELAAAMGLARSTVIQRLDYLLDHELVSTEPQPRRSRRPARRSGSTRRPPSCWPPRSA